VCACANVYHACDCSATGQAAVVRSDKLQMLEQKLYKAQEELMEFHRKKGEVSFCTTLCWPLMSSDAPSIWSLVVDEERIRLGHWLELVLCVTLSALTLSIGW